MGKVLSTTSPFLLIFAENPGNEFYVTLKEHFLILRDAAVFCPAYPRSQESFFLKDIERRLTCP